MEFFLLAVMMFISMTYSQSIDQRQVLRGGQITLVCPFMDDRLSWRTEPPPLFIYTIGARINPELPDDKKIELTGDASRGEYNLRIIDATFSDQGMYTCEDEYKRTRHTYDLKVIDDVKANITEDACLEFSLPDNSLGGNCRVYSGNLLVFLVISINNNYDVVFTFNSLRNRTTYTGNTSASIVSFCINDITLNDTGEFVFEVENKNRNYSIFLEVYVPLTEAMISTTNISVEVFKTVTIQCEVTSIPFPRITWFIRDIMVANSSETDFGHGRISSTFLYLATKEDHNSYIYCQATNNFTSVDSDKTVLNILYPATVSITPNGNSLKAVEGQNSVILKCSTVDGNPSTLYYKWYRNGSLVPYAQLDTFNISHVQKADEVTYGCQGYNGISSSFGNIAEVKVHVLRTPTPVLIDYACNASSTITMVCTMPDFIDFYYPLQWIHSYNNVIIRTILGEVIKDIFRLTIQFCNYQDTGQYSCVWKGSKSGLGLVNQTNNFIVNGPPIISQKFVTTLHDRRIISVMFYSVSYPRDPEWLYKGKHLAYGSKYQRSTSSKKVSLPLYNGNVILDGFITNLTIRDVNEFIGDIYSCKIENDVGFVEEEISTDVKDSLNENEMKVSASVTAGVGVGCAVLTVIIMVTGVAVVKRLRQQHITKIYKKGKENEGLEMYEDMDKPSPANIYDRVV